MSAGKTATPPTAMQRSKVCGVGRAQRHADTTRSIPARSARRSVRANPPRARAPRRPGPGRRPPRRARKAAPRSAACATSRRTTDQPVEPRVQRLRRLVARDLGRQLRPVLDVGRVADHGVELARALEQVGVHEANVEPEPRRVGARHHQRILADVGRRHREIGALVLEREGHRAAARADVDHARGRRQPERRLDQGLGLRARDEHARVDPQVEVAKALEPRDVGHRLAADRAAPHGVLEDAHGRPLHGRATVGEHLEAVDAQRVGEQDLGVQARRVDPRGAERDHRRVERLAHRRACHREAQLGAAACTSSRRRFSSAESPAVSSSSSPSSTASRLWTVSLMRWSVTRRSP